LNKHEKYKRKALEACRHVFEYEYNRSIGIPLPEIDFVPPDSTNYNSGEYGIKVDDTWQIYLNFGLLPVSYKEFQEEVRVLTRHEIEHYMCCPFDVLTHLRMINSIIELYNSKYSHYKIDIITLPRVLANQVADIIIDTKNYVTHRKETLKSEIAWIKKSGENFQELPRHSKLMFLTKEALWETSLELNETDVKLIEEVIELAKELKKDGITNRNLFIDKTTKYTESFFNLYEQDIQEQKSGDSKNTDNKNKRPFGQPIIMPGKDSQDNGSQFIFESPDKIKDAIEQLANEIALDQFSQVLSSAGLSSLSEKDKQKIWFNAQNSDVIPIVEHQPAGSMDKYAFPVTWKLGDPIEEIDMMLSYTFSPVIIPGITTKKWHKEANNSIGSEKFDSDLLLVIDTSGSMGSILKPEDNLHQAILASFGIIKYFESQNSQTALICFSDRISAYLPWTTDYDLVKESLLINDGGGTMFPISSIQKVLSGRNDSIVTVVITDGEFMNLSQTLDFFIDYLSNGNMLYIFHQDIKKTNNNFDELISYGAKVVKAYSAGDIRNLVLNDLM